MDKCNRCGESGGKGLAGTGLSRTTALQQQGVWIVCNCRQLSNITLRQMQEGPLLLGSLPQGTQV